MTPWIVDTPDRGGVDTLGDRTVGTEYSRYTALAFPAYAHRLGVTPHPVSDPRGHSHDPEHAPGVVVPPAPDDWRSCEAYLYGADLYNHGYWWEAHEAWEDLWRGAPPESVTARFLQGLIQAAACALQLEAERPRGVERLFARVAGHLQPAIDWMQTHDRPRYMGLDVPAWREALRDYYRDRAEACAHDPGAFPYLSLG